MSTQTNQMSFSDRVKKSFRPKRHKNPAAVWVDESLIEKRLEHGWGVASSTYKYSCRRCGVTMTALCCNNSRRPSSGTETRTRTAPQNILEASVYILASSARACVKRRNAVIFFFLSFFFFSLPLNKKSYSSSRFPILDEAAPTLGSGRGCAKSSALDCRYMPEKYGKGLRWDSAPVLAVKASWPQKGRAPNSAEGGEEPLRGT